MKNSNGEEYTPGKCCECRSGEHEDLNKVFKCCVTDPETGREVIKHLCLDHMDVADAEGYDVQAIREV